MIMQNWFQLIILQLKQYLSYKFLSFFIQFKIEVCTNLKAIKHVDVSVGVCVRHVRLTVSVDNANAECRNAERERGKEGGRRRGGKTCIFSEHRMHCVLFAIRTIVQRTRLKQRMANEKQFAM